MEITYACTLRSFSISTDATGLRINFIQRQLFKKVEMIFPIEAI